MAFTIPGLKRGRTGSRSINKKIPTTGTPTNGANALGNLGMAVKPTATNTVTVGASVYTFVASAENAGEVEIGAAVANSQANLVAAINGDALNPANAVMVAADFADDAMVITAKRHGTEANGYNLLQTLDDAGDVWTAALTAGGVDGTGGEAGDQLIDDTNIYFCMRDDTAALASTWRKIALSTL